MPTVQIPRTTIHRRELTFAQLVRRVYPRRIIADFDGKFFKPGSFVDEADLFPDAGYPTVPLLLEYAGNDHSGWGHRRSNDIYLLWKYDTTRHVWRELIKHVGQGAEWRAVLKPLAIRELRRNAPPVDAAVAAVVSGRVLSLLDQELETLNTVDRHLVMSVVYQEFSARAVQYA